MAVQCFRHHFWSATRLCSWVFTVLMFIFVLCISRPGAERAGLFLATHRLLYHVHNKHNIDVFGVVLDLLQNRSQIIQNVVSIRANRIILIILQYLGA
jgi:hypothetical protein